MSDVLKALLSILGFLASQYPEIAAFLSGLSNGDEKCAEELRKILPMESKSGAALRQFKGILP